MKKSYVIFRNILRGIGVLAFALYILFLNSEEVPLLKAASFADSSVYLLFLIFVLGFVLMWKNELISGIILILWYGIQWLLVFFVWVDGAMTLILGFPIAIYGILLLVYRILKMKALKNS